MQETKTGKTGPPATNIMCHLGKAQQGRGTRRTARENEPPFFWDAGCKKPKREQGGPPVLHTCSQPTLRTSRLLRNSIILLPMVVAVQAKRNMLWFQKRNFEFRNSLKIAEGCGTRHAAAQAHLFKLSYHDFRALSLFGRRESARRWPHSVVSRNITSSHPRIELALRPRRLC